MKAYLRPLIILLPVVLIISFFYFKNKKDSESTTALKESTDVEFLRLEGLKDWKGREINLEKYADANVVMHFWASWCAPCVHEFPDLIEMTEKEKGKTVVIAVAEDKDLKEVEVFVKSFPQALSAPHFHIVWDQDRSFMKRWKVDRLPESYIYSPGRKMVKRVSGAVSWTNQEALEFFKMTREAKSQ